MIKQKTIDEIFATAKIEEVVEDFLNLKRRGVNMIGLCPFHDEKTPSFTVSPAKNLYKCFGCGKGGTPVSFVMEHEAYSYPEALRYLAKKYNIEIEEKQFTQEDLQEKQKIDSFYIINEFAREHFKNNLFNTEEGKAIGLSYFKNRGFRENTIKKFNLGFALGSGRDFRETAKSKSYNETYTKELGLVSSKNNDFFRDRVMFTIHNISGKAIAFAGRTLKNDKKIPKYINSPESDIYNKRKVLFGLYFAKTAIRKADECILVEGYTDVISLSQSGVENVVASSGTSLTKEQIILIKRYTENIKIIYDGDAAGIKAALRGMDLILEADMNVKLVMLPTGEDPDSFMKLKGYEGFVEYLNENSKDFILFKTELLLTEAGNDPVKKANLLKDIVTSIAKIPDLVKRSVYIQECSIKLNMDENVIIKSVNSEIKNNIKANRLQQQREANVSHYEDKFETVKTTPYQGPKQQDSFVSNEDHQEKDIIRILVTLGHKSYDDDQNIDIATYVLSNIEDMLGSFKNPLYQKIVNTIVEKINAGVSVSPEYFKNHENQEIRELAIDMMTTPYNYANWEEKGVYLQTQREPELNGKKDSKQAILRFKLKKINAAIQDTESKIKNAVSEIDRDTYIKVLQHYYEQRSIIAKELNTVVF